jgi:four helix bundle protein
MSRKVERFEDLIAWEKGMDLAVAIYEITSQRPFSRDFPLVDQARRAAISVPSNTAEGFDRGTRAEFHRFLSIAKGSCAELRTHLHLAKRLGHINEEKARELLQQSEELSKIIGGLRATVAKQRDTRAV